MGVILPPAYSHRHGVHVRRAWHDVFRASARGPQTSTFQIAVAIAARAVVIGRALRFLCVTFQQRKPFGAKALHLLG